VSYLNQFEFWPHFSWDTVYFVFSILLLHNTTSV